MPRVSGVTIPLFSIRSRRDWGIGQITDLPACAEWLKSAGQRLIQVLPTHELSFGETSPYGALSAFALDPIYIDIAAIEDLDEPSIETCLGESGRAELTRLRAASRVDYEAVRRLKKSALSAAFERFRTRELGASSPRAQAFFAFIARESAWLRDHSLYSVFRASHAGYGWKTWPEPERDRHASVCAVAADPHDDGDVGTRLLQVMYEQWLAHTQWQAARAELRSAGVLLMGDMPFIVGTESADVWSHRAQFRCDVSLGAPPDDFSADGQNWGLPAYDWATMDSDNLAWLRLRSRHAAALFDTFRIDHLVGFFRQWVRREGAPGHFLPDGEQTQKDRGERVLKAILEATGPEAVIGEDLGVIPGFVRETMAHLGLPGYKVLPWERDGNFMPINPGSFSEISVATWSTHDTAPITAWWYDFEPWERERLAAAASLPPEATEEQRELALLAYLFSARSRLTLVLVQELIGDKTRINLPGTVNGENWTWRLPRPIEDLREDTNLAARFEAIRHNVERAGR